MHGYSLPEPERFEGDQQRVKLFDLSKLTDTPAPATPVATKTVAPLSGARKLALKEIERWEVEDIGGRVFWQFTPNGETLLFGVGVDSNSCRSLAVWDVEKKTAIKIPSEFGAYSAELFGEGI